MKKIFYTIIITLSISDIFNNSIYSQNTQNETRPYISDIKYKILSNNQKKLKPEESKYIKKYIIEKWDSLYKISKKFNIKIETLNKINWRNIKKLYPNEEIYISNINWTIHTIEINQSINDIAKIYKVSKEEIYKYNSFLEKWVVIWDKIFIYNWTIYEEIWKDLLTKDSFQLKHVDNNSKFKVWYCTWFVSQFKNINWTWDANEWIDNAKKKNKTWKIAKKWSIIVFNWRWYSRKYWHVWIVMNIIKDKLIIWEMNYFKKNQISYREIDKNDPAIIWYIY